ncbi:jg25736 [Pararge aegeria aegeria]|uniref:Jg25736 protein n=1 Tax=Pararge aegeria aegeria TaxID=348720 RepID=A0A8S4QHS1_9NEOP|nr:jg25736 [Pararge aegeria aegeria]
MVTGCRRALTPIPMSAMAIGTLLFQQKSSSSLHYPPITGTLAGTALLPQREFRPLRWPTEDQWTHTTFKNIVESSQTYRFPHNVSVQLSKIRMKKAKRHDAYKFDIPNSKLSVFMDENMWPEGIAFRRYLFFKHKGKHAPQTAETAATVCN